MVTTKTSISYFTFVTIPVNITDTSKQSFSLFFFFYTSDMKKDLIKTGKLLPANENFSQSMLLAQSLNRHAVKECPKCKSE